MIKRQGKAMKIRQAKLKHPKPGNLKSLKTALVLILALGLAMAAAWPGPALAEDSPEIAAKEPEAQPESSWLDQITAKWGGHLKVGSMIQQPHGDSYYQLVGTRTYYDGFADLRLLNQLFFSDWGHFEVHYQADIRGGDSYRKNRQLAMLFPGLVDPDLSQTAPIDDDRRLMDLTKTVKETGDYVVYHRLDRLNFSVKGDWGTIRIGRQALTWGNGLMFNPMDLFNPFAPTDIERDYKVGDDMVVAQIPLTGRGDFQALYVPRRNPVTGNVEIDQSSIAGKLHLAAGETEFDFMAARHYGDTVVGMGATGYLLDAAWRTDLVWTILSEDPNRDGYLSFVANMDYSWVWFGKNFYGLIEFYYNGIGKDDYFEAITDPAILERLDRGEIFTLGRYYLSGQIQLELHPLFHLYLASINNLADPSGLLQPYAVWDAAQNFQVTFGMAIPWGADGTEFGGFSLRGTPFIYKTPPSAYVWATYYF